MVEKHNGRDVECKMHNGDAEMVCRLALIEDFTDRVVFKSYRSRRWR